MSKSNCPLPSDLQILGPNAPFHSLSTEEGGPVFGEPSQAQAFATAVHLSRRGLFTWKEWVETFSSEIARNPQSSEESVEVAYFRQWVAALEQLLSAKDVLTSSDLESTQDHWFRSYLNNDHGSPVEFSREWPVPTDEDLAEIAHHHHHHDHDDEHVLSISPIAVDSGFKRH